MKFLIPLLFVCCLPFNILCQNKRIVDTLFFKNEVIFIIDSIIEVDKTTIRNSNIFMIPSFENDLDSSRYLFNNVLYSLDVDFTSKLDKNKELYFITKENEINEYINNNKLSYLIQDSVIDKKKKLLFIIINN